MVLLAILLLYCACDAVRIINLLFLLDIVDRLTTKIYATHNFINTHRPTDAVSLTDRRTVPLLKVLNDSVVIV